MLNKICGKVVGAMIRDMTQGSPAKLIWTFTIPMFIGNIFQQLYNMVDAIVVGRFIGPQALAAVGTSFPVIFLLVAVVLGLSMGSGVVISQYFGAKDEEKTRRAISTALTFQIVLALVMSVVGVVLSRPLLLLLGTPEAILGDATSYMQIFFGGVVFMFAYNALAGILRSLGDSKTPLYFLIVSTLVNVVLNIYFVVVLKWGVPGVAWATVISQGVSSLLSLLYIYYKVPYLKFLAKQWVFDRAIFATMVKIGIPSSIQQGIASVGMMFVQALVNSFGPTTMAAFAAAGRMDSFAMMPIMNLGMAVATYTGQNIGAGRFDRISQGVRATLAMVIVSTVLITLLVLTAGPYLIQIFVTDAEVEVIAQGVDYLRTVSLFYVIFGVLMVLNGVLRGAGDALIPLFTSLASLVVRVGAAYWLTTTALGYRGIWWSIPIGWSVAMLVPTLRYLSGAWKAKSVVRRQMFATVPAVVVPETGPDLD